MPNEIEPKTTRTVYYYTPPIYALENLRHNRIKISRFGDVNDPFELEAVNLTNKKFRKTYNEICDTEIHAKLGFLSFSRSWQISIMWSHYSAKQRGFGFEFEAKAEPLFDVNYSQERMFQGIRSATVRTFIGEEQIKEILSTKHTHWAYEEEVRAPVNLSEDEPDENGNYFFDFGEAIRLTAIYLGPDCKIGINEVKEALNDPSVEIIPTRRSFKHFKVVKQLDKSLWNYHGLCQLTADQIIKHLNLAPHPEGGHYRQTWAADNDGRPSGTCIYFLLKAGEYSHWHRVDAVEIWLYHAGAPLTLSVAATDTGPKHDCLLGRDLLAGQNPQIIIAKGHWQSAKTTGDYTLVSCTVSPGFEFGGFTLAPPGFDIP